jgi:hypothetical protein
MRVETNQSLIQRNRRLAQIMFFVSLGLLSLGFIVTNSRLLFPSLSVDALLIVEFVLPILVLPLAFLSTLFSVRLTNLWVRLPRPDAVIPENLKGLGSGSVLYNYYHFPARHVLICPNGVFALVTRFQRGSYTVEGDKWRSQRGIFDSIFGFFRMDRLGNPSRDAEDAADAVQALIDQVAPESKITVKPVVVFVDPRVQLTVNNPTISVVHAQTNLKPSLKDYVKSQPKTQMLTPAQIRAFEQASGVVSAEEA